MSNKRHYSYFLIKPDGIKYLKEISEYISSKKFDRIIYFSVEDWEKTQKDLYEENYKKKGFQESYQAFIDAEKTVYGNRAIAIVVSSKEGTYQELVEKVYKTKLELRKKLASNIGLVTISDEIDETKTNQILIVGKQGNEIEKPKKFDKPHKRYRLSYLNAIHCPDPEIEVTLKELNKLFKNKVISDENIISDELEKLIRKYKTAEFLQDQSENQLHTSNYSYHILTEIKHDENEK